MPGTAAAGWLVGHSPKKDKALRWIKWKRLASLHHWTVRRPINEARLSRASRRRMVRVARKSERASEGPATPLMNVTARCRHYPRRARKIAFSALVNEGVKRDGAASALSVDLMVMGA